MSSKINSKGNGGFLCIDTHNFLPHSFQWKVDITYIKSNFSFGLQEVKNE